MARKTRKRSGGNPFAGRDARIAELEAQIESLATFIMQEIPNEPLLNEGAVDTAIRIMRNQHNLLIQTTITKQDKAVRVSELNENIERIMAQAKATEARAREIEPRYQREIAFLRETITRLANSGFQVEQTYRVID